MSKSKILFKKLRWQNFLTYGNYWTELNLDNNEIIVISGKNGSGKSTMMDAFYFALTGKPYRNVLINGLINNINNKLCSIELEFTKGEDNYLIKRGINPNIFQIYKNDELIPEDGKRINYYQIKLEKITGLTPIIIKNTLLINTTLKPFFKLSKGEKREFIDGIFPSLNVFSKMLNKQKTKFDQLTIENSNLIHQRDLLLKSIEHQKEQLKQYDSIVKEIESQKKKDLTNIESRIENLTIKYSIYSENLSDAKKQLDELKNKKHEISSKLLNHSVIFGKQDKLKIEISKIESKKINDICSECGQIIPQEKIEELKKQYSNEISKLKSQYDQFNLDIISLFNILNISDLEKTINLLNNKISEIDNKILLLEEYISKIDKAIYSNEKTVSGLKKEVEMFTMKLPEKPEIDISSNKEKLKEVNEKIEKNKEILKYLKIVNKILLDGELKSYIISNYIPFINEQFNFFLEMFNMDIKIKFDSEFEWKILTRKYNNYQFDNFSNGEKMRLNLALMFTFIQLAKVISFGNLQLLYNVLFIDEFLDNGLDKDGISDCLNMLNEKNKSEHISMFLISHKFDPEGTDFKIINVKKEQNFSRMEMI